MIKLNPRYLTVNLMDFFVKSFRYVRDVKCIRQKKMFNNTLRKVVFFLFLFKMLLNILCYRVNMITQYYVTLCFTQKRREALSISPQLIDDGPQRNLLKVKLV